MDWTNSGSRGALLDGPGGIPDPLAPGAGVKPGCRQAGKLGRHREMARSDAGAAHYGPWRFEIVTQRFLKRTHNTRCVEPQALVIKIPRERQVERAGNVTGNSVDRFLLAQKTFLISRIDQAKFYDVAASGDELFGRQHALVSRASRKT